jgi:hypothetical protein
MYLIVANRLYSPTAEEWDQLAQMEAEIEAEARNERFWEDGGADDGFDEWEARRGVMSYEEARDAAYGDHCFVCGRHTDHVGEHDDLMIAGMVTYSGGSVVLTDSYDEKAARLISDAAYEVYCAPFDGKVSLLKAYAVHLTPVAR